MQLLRQKLAFMIDDCSTILGEFSCTVNKKDESTLSSLVQKNDEVLKSLEKYEQLMQDLQCSDAEQLQSQRTMGPAAGHAVTAGGSSQSSSSAVPVTASFTSSTSLRHLRTSVAKILDVLKEHLEPFHVLLTNMVGDPTHRVDTASQTADLKFIVRNLEALQRKLAGLIEEWSGMLNFNSTSISKEDEATFISLTRANDMICTLLNKYLRAYDEILPCSSRIHQRDFSKY
ncbi:unnamed protein product [Dibothriocephalus latus]|uniref:GAT domain-containing protein n=1 Tax=Dibothriocephalus latus TaxID=60516 RepID=A0A3P6UZZ1_DIBLA|nr:unnamed protein product [Dibothriocephalus latus]